MGLFLRSPIEVRKYVKFDLFSLFSSSFTKAIQLRKVKHLLLLHIYRENCLSLQSYLETTMGPIAQSYSSKRIFVDVIDKK